MRARVMVWIPGLEERATIIEMLKAALPEANVKGASTPEVALEIARTDHPLIIVAGVAQTDDDGIYWATKLRAESRRGELAFLQHRRITHSDRMSAAALGVGAIYEDEDAALLVKKVKEMIGQRSIDNRVQGIMMGDSSGDVGHH